MENTLNTTIALKVMYSIHRYMFVRRLEILFSVSAKSDGCMDECKALLTKFSRLKEKVSLPKRAHLHYRYLHLKIKHYSPMCEVFLGLKKFL